MDKTGILNEIYAQYEACPLNFVTKEDAICEEMVGLKMFDRPLIGIGSAADALFTEFKKENVIGPWFMTPTEWLPEAKSVISLFFPFTEEVKAGNRAVSDGPSPAWLHGRIEGQKFLTSYIAGVKKWLEENGVKACAPGIDERFVMIMSGNHFTEYDSMTEKTFGSNWSERHAAYICGLGTFGLSKGIITEKGMAGRLISLIVSQELECDERSYTGIYDYCIQCGACIRRCPVQAISFEKGKDHTVCSGWLAKMKEIHAPRIGCGLCQTAVPCESVNPTKIKNE